MPELWMPPPGPLSLPLVIDSESRTTVALLVTTKIRPFLLPSMVRRAGSVEASKVRLLLIVIWPPVRRMVCPDRFEAKMMVSPDTELEMTRRNVPELLSSAAVVTVFVAAVATCVAARSGRRKLRVRIPKGLDWNIKRH